MHLLLSIADPQHLPVVGLALNFYFSAFIINELTLCILYLSACIHASVPNTQIFLCRTSNAIEKRCKIGSVGVHINSRGQYNTTYYRIRLILIQLLLSVSNIYSFFKINSSKYLTSNYLWKYSN